MRSLIFLLELTCIVVAALLAVQLLLMSPAPSLTSSQLMGWAAVLLLVAGAWCLHQVFLASIGYVPRSYGDDFYGDEP